jgi:hypothetical protein
MIRQLIVLLILLPIVGLAQSSKRIQPGKVYEPGEALYAPRLGFRAAVPQGWTGVLPRESEVFLLSSYTSPAEVFVLARESGTVEQLKKDWELGFDMDENIRIKAKGAAITNGTLTAEVIATGDFINKSMRGYAIARCSPHGPCVTALAIMPSPQFDEIKKVADAFMAASSFEAPSFASPYADFDWKEFLTGKMISTYAYLEQGSKETTIHLCADGRFTGKATKKGILRNQNPDYKGKLSGTWTVEGIGERGRITLKFDKLPPIKAELTIKEEKIFANDERYFVGNSDQCK